MQDAKPNRRTIIRSAGVVALSLLAGCTNTDSSTEGGAGDSSSEEETNSANEGGETNDSTTHIEPPAEVDEYLSDANLYEGSVVDMTDRDSIEVSVGAGETGLAFDPPAVRVSPNTAITWTWTGEGGAHNVVSESTGSEENQNESNHGSNQEHAGSESNGSDQNQNESGEHSDHGHSSQGMLNSGEPEQGADITYDETISEPGTYLYHCHPHEEAGMRGAIIVQEQ